MCTHCSLMWRHKVGMLTACDDPVGLETMTGCRLLMVCQVSTPRRPNRRPTVDQWPVLNASFSAPDESAVYNPTLQFQSWWFKYSEPSEKYEQEAEAQPGRLSLSSSTNTTKCKIKSLHSPSRSRGFMRASLAAAQLNVALGSFMRHGRLLDLQQHNCDVLRCSNTEITDRNQQTSQHWPAQQRQSEASCQAPRIQKRKVTAAAHGIWRADYGASVFYDTQQMWGNWQSTH